MANGQDTWREDLRSKRWPREHPLLVSNDKKLGLSSNLEKYFSLQSRETSLFSSQFFERFFNCSLLCMCSNLNNIHNNKFHATFGVNYIEVLDLAYSLVCKMWTQIIITVSECKIIETWRKLLFLFRRSSVRNKKWKIDKGLHFIIFCYALPRSLIY